MRRRSSGNLIRKEVPKLSQRSVAALAIARMERVIDVPTFESELHRRAESDVRGAVVASASTSGV